MSIVLNKKKIETVPGIGSTVSWLDGNPKVKRCTLTDMKPRTRTIRGIVCHTHEGVRGLLKEGVGPNTTIDERLAMYQVSTDRYVSWEYTHDLNGDVTWQNDPTEYYTFQAGSVNDVTFGFEMIQELIRDSKGNVISGNLYSGQLQSVVRMLDFLTLKLGIQRQIPWDTNNNRPIRGVISRIAAGGEDVVGIYGHRNVTNKGEGDPGDSVFYALRDAGYELFDMRRNEDKTTWQQRQATLGLTELDGIPLKNTVAALKAAGKKHGMWVKRPVDDQIDEE